MENRKDILSAAKICRFCLSQNKSLVSLYEKNKSSKNTVTLPLKILSCISVEVFPSDKKPTYICERCKFFMNMFYEYKHIVRQADQSVHQYVQNGTPIGTVTWPISLIKMFRSVYEPESVKTVVKGGATIQVSSHDISESDEDIGSVYNVKIGDDEETKTCIKVVTSKDGNVKENAKGKDKEVEENKEVEKEIEERCWACDECNCTYPLQQLLDLHKIQKHRVRTEECDQCDAKFFSKYDLATHQVRHSCDTPFQCVACGKKFKRQILLKRHEKLMHPDIPQLVCPNCPASFLAEEELEEHQKRHVRISKPYGCSKCDKKFYEKSTLQRHKDVVHNKEKSFSCEYCPERFHSISKLARHVRSHAGERPYPCKYCNKSFLKSHHYTRHLRLKHRDIVRSLGTQGATEQYRCEQCEDTFESQDDLIYHSAIHATQNLTCPLCQERFEDVEAVTAHIKSHVNGEFMCDYCELIFTTQAKLDMHQMMAHEDEIQNEAMDESSIEMDGEDEDDDNGLNVKEDGDDMIIEVKKPNNYLVDDVTENTEDKIDNTNSEESESEVTYTDIRTVDALAILTKDPPKDKLSEKPAATTDKITDSQARIILQKADEVKRKAPQTSETAIIKKIKPKADSSNSGSANDKSLRLLEKELQDLKRTNSRNTETAKSSAKVLETLKTKRPQFQTSTPKIRSIEERKQIATKLQSTEKKQPEKRIVTKENKEPKETKEAKNNNGNSKEEKDSKEKEKEKDSAEKDRVKETPKSIVKNGSTDRNSTEEGVRRSTRPSKIKDYAKMIRENTKVSSDDEDTTEDDEDYCEPEKTLESRRGRRVNPVVKTPVAVTKTPPAQTTPANPKRKRGRPRKQNTEVPVKIKKEEPDDAEEAEDSTNENNQTHDDTKSSTAKQNKTDTEDTTGVTEEQSTPKTPPQTDSSSNVIVSPSGQTLKKIPVKALPPGVRAMPLPANARTMPVGELCQMQIGKKVVKVQKIVMTKAEVEAMAKKGLVEMKDGTMVLKQGIKLPTADVSAVKSSLIGDGDSEKDPSRKEKAAPSRCDFGDES